MELYITTDHLRSCAMSDISSGMDGGRYFTTRFTMMQIMVNNIICLIEAIVHKSGIAGEGKQVCMFF